MAVACAGSAENAGCPPTVIVSTADGRKSMIGNVSELNGAATTISQLGALGNSHATDNVAARASVRPDNLTSLHLIGRDTLAAQLLNSVTG